MPDPTEPATTTTKPPKRRKRAAAKSREFSAPARIFTTIKSESEMFDFMATALNDGIRAKTEDGREILIKLGSGTI